MVTYFLVDATLQNVKRVKGVRCSVYDKAEKECAFYPCAGAGDERAIWYDDDNLRVQVAFKSEERAMVFASALRNWHVFKPDFIRERVIVSDVPTMCSVRQKVSLRPILLDQYDPDAYPDSAGQGVEDVCGSVSSMTTAVAEPDSDLVKFQSIEQLGIITFALAERLHLIDSAVCKAEEGLKKYLHDEDNMIAASHTFHQVRAALLACRLARVPSLVPSLFACRICI